MTINKRSILRGVLAVLLVSTALLTGLMITNANGESWSDNDHAKTDWYDPIYATYTIDSAEKLAGVAELVNNGTVDGFEGKILQIDTDLDLSDYWWVPIGNEANPFRGTFITKDGIDYNISGLRLQGNWKYAGLFGYVDNGTVGGFNITSDNNASFNVSADSDDIYAGTAVAYMNGNSTVFDITNSLNIVVDGDDYAAHVGGIVGHSEGYIGDEPLFGKLSNVANSGNVTVAGNAAVGGIIGSIGGELAANIMTPTNNGAITVNGKPSLEVIAGGIVGYAQAAVTLSEDDTITMNRGLIAVNDGSYSYAGGIIGKSDTEADFSIYTFNEGTVTIEAPEGNASYAGGLVGASQGTVQGAVAFVNSGAVTNNGDSEVHTGGMIGLLETAFSLDHNFTNTVAITATGTENLYTGGVIGKALDDVTFNGHIMNTANVNVTGNGALTEAYTGGLIGYAETQIWLENVDAMAYANTGALQVTGNEFLYTGGIIANRAYSRTGGLPDNVISTGNITVDGDSYLFTGGFIGKLGQEAIEQSVTGASYAAQILVQGAEDTESMVATGGIIGLYQSNQGDALLSNLSFSGQLQATAGDETTYTGGIVGYADDAAMLDVSSGAVANGHALIESEGVLGGIAGYVNGSIEQAEVQYVTLTASSVGAIAGGVAGQATGSITGASVGDSAAEGSASVIFNTEIDGNTSGVDELTAGGIVGVNTTALVITDSVVERITLLNEQAHSQYVFGGIAGALNDQASLGEEGSPLHVNNVTVALAVDDSQLGGAIGYNEAPQLYIHTDHVVITATGDQAVVGGVIGKNAGVMGLDTTGLYSAYTTIHASGVLPKAGGIAGENIGTLVEAVSEKADLTATSVESVIGGVAGYNASKLTNVIAINASIKSNADSILAGGIVGYSAPNADTTADGVIIENASVQKTEALPLLTTTGVNSKIGGIVGSALSTEVINPAVTGAAPNSVIILGQASDVMAGGIAGYIENGSVVGDMDTITANANNTTVRNIAFRFNSNAEDSFIGGLAGYAEATAFDAMSVHTEVITLEAQRGTVGGAVGYYHGDSVNEAIISNMILNTVTLRGMETAEHAIIGGMIGVNAAQGNDAVAAPNRDVSTLKNARIIGNLANPNSPIIDSRAANAIVGGIVGDNSSFVANVSLIDLNAMTVSGANSIVGGHTGVNQETGVIYNTYANAKLTVTGATTTVGGLVGSNKGTIIGSYVDTPVNSGSAGAGETLAPLGGLVGINEGAIKTSYVQSNVVASGTRAIVGGLVGLQLSGSIEQSYAGGNVTASGTSSYGGGFAGKIVDGSIQYSYSAMNVKAASSAHAGGFAGRYDTANKELLYKNYYIKDEKVNLNKDLPDFADGNYRWLNLAARLNTVLDETLKDRTLFPELSEWDFTNIWRYGSVNGSYLYPELIRVANDGGGSEHNVNANVAWYTHDTTAAVYEIRTEAELSGLAAIVNGTVPGVEQFGFNKRIIRIMNPIHIQAKEWIPIGKFENYPFEGTFDGNGDVVEGEGFLIDGYRMGNGTAATGLFGYVDAKAKIEHVNLEPLSLSGAEYVGALAAVNQGTVSNVKLHLGDGVSLSGQTVGGLLGKNSGSVTGIKLTSEPNVSITGTVAEGAVGSLIGNNESNLNLSNGLDNQFVGVVSSTSNDTAVGGWIGRQAGDIEGLTEHPAYEVLASGENNVVGGFIGHYVEGTLENIGLELGNKKLVASSNTSTLGGVVGRSEADHVMNNVTVTSLTGDAPYIQGNGIVGGVIGSKTGSAGQGWDVTAISITDAMIGSQSGAPTTIIGGLIGQLDDAAVKGLSFDGQLLPLSLETTAGGIVGVSNESVLYDVDAELNVSYEAKQGTSKLGGIAGMLHADDVDASYSLGHGIPLYMGVYLGNVQQTVLDAQTAQSGVNAYIGGIAGHNDNASIYFSDAESQLNGEGFLSTKLGGLVGDSSGIIVQSTATPVITADRNTLVAAGGLVGSAHGGEIHYSQANASAGQAIHVSNMKTAHPVLPEGFVGGFVGVANEVEMSRVFSDLSVNVESQNQEDSIYAGGFAGALGNEYDLDPAQIQWAHALGDVTIVGKSVSFGGGFSGTINYYDVTDAYAKGTVKATGHDMRSGGFAAAVDRYASIKDSWALQNKLQVTGVAGTTRAYVGGFAAYSEGSLENVYAHATDLNNVAGANTYKGGLVGYQFSDGSVIDSAYRLDGDAVGYQLGTVSNVTKEDRSNSINLADWELLTDATILLDSLDGLVVNNPIQLNTSVLLTNDSTGLDYFKLFKRDTTAKLEMNTKLGTDIDLSQWNWLPYESFDLVFDGQGHTLTGLTINNAQSNHVGFMLENSGTVQNVRFLDATVSAGDDANVGIVVATNLATGKLMNVEVVGEVAGGSATGSIAGMNEGSIMESSAEATVTSNRYAGGVVGVNKGNIEELTVDVIVAVAETEDEPADYMPLASDEQYAGGIAGLNEGSIEIATVHVIVNGGSYAGGVTGYNDGNITEITLNEIEVTGSSNVGGVAASNDGSVTGILIQGVISGADAVGGIAAINGGDIVDVTVDATVSGGTLVGGVAGRNSGHIEEAAVQGTVSGSTLVGGVAGMNEGSIENVTAEATVTGDEQAGGVAGNNSPSATITEASAIGGVTATAVAGGLTAINEGSISKSYAGSTVTAPTAGGITGKHTVGALIEETFAFGSVTATGETATAGGIAGESSGGLIYDSYSAGIIRASGSELAYGGGIVGYAKAGQITTSMNYGEVAADVAGKIVKGKSFAGGIAGQKLAAAGVMSTISNKDMLQNDVVYYNENGVRVLSNPLAGASSSYGEFLVGESPFFSNEKWIAVEGYFPQLSHFAGTEAAKASSAAVYFNENKSAYSVVTSFKSTHANELAWSSDKAQFTNDGHEASGVITGSGIVDVTVTAGKLTKALRLNVPGLDYEGKAAKPSFVTENVPFKDSVLVEMTTTEEDAVIYYTLDKSAPTAQSLRYTGPIELTATTTIRAIAIADDLNPSDELSGVWRKQAGNGGGVFIPIVVEQEYLPVLIGDKELPVRNGSRATVARNSKISLVVPEDVIVYYTTDGSMPTVDSPVYTGEVHITHNMQLKYMTSKDSTVVTLNYNVAPAEFSIKEKAATLTYISGYSNNTFSPNQAITREELIVGLYELLNIENVPLATLLTDVTAEQADLVAKFESAGLVEGYSDGTFRGTKGLTRAEFVTIVTRILKLEVANSTNGKFTDTQGHWASKYINAVAAAGHIKGYSDGSFKPDQEITRAEAVVLINRIFGIQAKADTRQDYSDVPPNHWAYQDIMNATK